jgi:CRP/FNR family transcriptional regulator, cyclic AMP receptor protein
MPIRDRDTKVTLLAGVPMFSLLSRRELSRLSALMTEIDVRPKEVLVREGEPGRECFIIGEGSAKAVIGRRTIATLGPGSVFGEMSLLDGGPRTATVTAQTPMRLYVLDPASFLTMLNRFPSVTRKILRVMAERLRAAEKAPTH